MAEMQSNHIDFDFWRQLAEDDPERFENLRSETLETCIKRASDARQNRLRGLQWRIDRVRDMANTPMAACISISGMMWDTFNNLASGYKHLENLRQDQQGKLPKAVVIPLKPRKI